jgi:hypothetical protein
MLISKKVNHFFVVVQLATFEVRLKSESCCVVRSFGAVHGIRTRLDNGFRDRARTTRA